MNKYFEELYDSEHPEQEYQEQELPTDLRQLKTFYAISDDDEGKLIVAIYNRGY